MHNQPEPSNQPDPLPLIESVASPAGLGIKIDDVDQSVWAYIRRRKKRHIIIFLPLLILWEVAGLASIAVTGQVGIILMLLPGIFFYSWYRKLKFDFESAFLQEFALLNNFTFDESGDVDRTSATIFKLPGVGISNVVSGVAGGHDLHLFVSQAVIGEGRNRTIMVMSILQIRLAGNLPWMFMRNKHIADWGALPSYYPTQNIIDLEGDFNNYFSLYADDEDRTAAREVFAPDLMAFMEDESRQFSVELCNNYLHIYINGMLTTTDNVKNLFAVAQRLIGRLEPVSRRMLLADQIDQEIEKTPA